jgi:hypothetical protein
MLGSRAELIKARATRPQQGISLEAIAARFHVRQIFDVREMAFQRPAK